MGSHSTLRAHFDALIIVLDTLPKKYKLLMIVLNSRDWSEIVWLLEILHFKNQTFNRLYSKKPNGMHWLGYYDAVSWLNEAKTGVFQPTANFENFNISYACQPASQPSVRPSSARCRAPEISHDKSS